MPSEPAVGGALIDLTSESTTIAIIGVGVAGISLVFLPIAAIRNASLVARSGAG